MVLFSASLLAIFSISQFRVSGYPALVLRIAVLLQNKIFTFQVLLLEETWLGRTLDSRLRYTSLHDVQERLALPSLEKLPNETSQALSQVPSPFGFFLYRRSLCAGGSRPGHADASRVTLRRRHAIAPSQCQPG